MSTPKPGQIRCPTCLRSTPPAAFCTQCGSPIPASARVRPRGMDRDELEERVRRRPGEGSIFRRGQQIEDSPASAGYVPFEPEPEDSLALRPESGDSSVYQGPPRDASEDTQQIQRPAAPPAPSQPADRGPEQSYRPPSQPPQPRQEPPAYAPPAYPPPAAGPSAAAAPPPAAAAPAQPREPAPSGVDAQPPVPDYEPVAEDAIAADAYDDYDDRPYGDPEDAYPYPYAAAEGRGGGGGGGALPIIGFVVLCVLALAVGAVLAGVFTGNETGQSTPTPIPSVATPTPEPTPEPTTVPTETGAPATPEPTDGPVTFADGAQLSIQACATRGFRDAAVGKPELDACEVDGSVNNGDVTTLVVFRSTGGDDALRIQLRQNGEVIDVQDLKVGDILSSCGATCGGLVYGPHYVDLPPGDYELVLRRNGDFADSATFTVGG